MDSQCSFSVQPRGNSAVVNCAVVNCAVVNCAVETRARRRTVAAGALALGALLWLLEGCVMVRPEEREFLADPSMTFGAGGELEAVEAHVLNNREGAYGAGGVTGGGCGCN